MENDKELKGYLLEKTKFEIPIHVEDEHHVMSATLDRPRWKNECLS